MVMQDRSSYNIEKNEPDPTYELLIEGSVAAGNPSGAFLSPGSKMSVSEEYPDTFYALHVNGDSMDGGPNPIPDGSIILVEKVEAVTPKNGSVGVFQIDGEAVLKLYEKKGRWPKLKSANPDFEDASMTEDTIYQARFVKILI